MFTWLKPEMIITALIGLAGMAGTVLLNLNASSIHAALSDANMARLETRLATIEAQTSGMPLYVLRLSQLEAWEGEQKGYNGGVDGRINVIHDDVERLKQASDDMKRASGIKLRGN